MTFAEATSILEEKRKKLPPGVREMRVHPDIYLAYVGGTLALQRFVEHGLFSDEAYPPIPFKTVRVLFGDPFYDTY